MDDIYTHYEAAVIVEMFEDVLISNGIKIPSPEDDEREAKNDAALYGSVWSDLLDDVENRLIYILSKHKPGTNVISNEYSGMVLGE